MNHNLSTKSFYHIILILIFLHFVTGCTEKDPVEEVITPKEYIPEPFNSLVFIGTAKTTPYLYFYSPEGKLIKELWNPGKEKIIELSYSPDRSSGFFITAAKTGKKGVFPFINGIKLYVINNDSVISNAGNIGDAVQIFARWETNSAFRIFINSMNKSIPSQITQTIQIYNTYGKLFEQEEKVYDLLRDGYPQPMKEELEFNSPGNEYAFITKSGNADSLFFFYQESRRKVFLLSTAKVLSRILWSPDVMYAVVELISKERTNEPAAADLIVYSIKDRKIIEQWNGITPNAFFIKNNLLILDNGRKNKSSIVFYDFDKRVEADTISMKGGCSLRTILN